MEETLRPRAVQRPVNVPNSTASNIYGETRHRVRNVARSTLLLSNHTKQSAMSGRDLYLMAQHHLNERQGIEEGGLSATARLKPPRNFAQRLVYAVAAASVVPATLQPFPLRAHTCDVLSQGNSLPVPKNNDFDPRDFSNRPPSPVKRQKRDTLAFSSQPEPSWRYRLAAFMNFHASSGLDLYAIDDQQLAKAILHSIEPRPELIPDIARLAMFGSQLYGERLGEDISPEQQREMIGQALCQLIFKEDSIAMRTVRLFARMRPCTLRELSGALRNWTFTIADEVAQQIWWRHYEAYEMPDMYLKSEHNLGLKQKKQEKTELSQTNTDDLWIGSPTWVLLHTGARTLLSSGLSDLAGESVLSIIELGIGIISVYERGLLSKVAEPALYYSLTMYHLTMFPEFDIEHSASTLNMTQTFEHLLDTLAVRRNKALQIYDSFSAYQQIYKTHTWRWRKWAARELLMQICGRSPRLVPIEKKSYFLAFQGVYNNPILQLMAYPTGQRCFRTNKIVPDLDTFYRNAVQAFAHRILEVDKALLAVAFTPSDFDDDNLQPSEWNYLTQAKIELVEPRLYRKRYPHEMFFSNKVIRFLNKADTMFLNARHNGLQRLYSLKTTKNGYVLKRININDPELRELQPYMQNWPATGIRHLYTFHIIPLNNPAIIKTPEEDIEQFYIRYASMHYLAYQARLYEIGYQEVGSELAKIIDDIKGLIIPFYDCINSLKDGNQNAAFLECSIDGILVGLPVFFAGVKSSFAMYRNALIGIARAYERTPVIATNTQLFKATIPISAQIGGGIIEAGEHLNTFISCIGSEIIKTLDPGIAAIRSFKFLSNSLRLAIAGHTLLKFSPQFMREGLRLSTETHKFLTIRTERFFDFTYGYGENGLTPLTMAFEGVDYSLIETESPIIQAPMIMVENGELTDQGQPVFVQLDLQTHLGIYKKYICLDIGEPQCKLQNYQPQNAALAIDRASKEGGVDISQWLLIGTQPIHLAVVYPQHRLSFGGQQKLFFEINGQGWTFNPEIQELYPVGYLDDWKKKLRAWNDPLTTLDIMNNATNLQLSLHQTKSGTTLPNILWRFRTSRAFLSAYELKEQHQPNTTIDFFDNASLKARIDNCWYWLVLEPRKSTFLLMHPTRKRMGSFRVIYDFLSRSFLLATPSDQLNAHRLGETLSQEMAAAVLAPCVIRLLPPLLNGAFRFGSEMFIKSGDDCLPIRSFDGLYYVTLDSNILENPLRWILRYELFTESFALVAKTDPMLAPIDYQGWSRLEELATRVYNITAFPSFRALCRTDFKESALHSRLRQTALMIRLDPMRRMMLLHASSAIVRAFRMDASMPVSFKATYPALAMWSTFENTIHMLVSSNSLQMPSWNALPLVEAKNLSARFPPPVLISQGHKQQIILVYKSLYQETTPISDYVELVMSTRGLEIRPAPSRDKPQRWLPNLLDTPLVTVSKYMLSFGRQMTFWMNNAGQLIGKQPQDDNVRFAGNYNLTNIKNAVVSPDGEIVVLIYSVYALSLRAEFYQLPRSQTTPLLQDIAPYRQMTILGNVELNCEYWVTNQGELFIPRENGWTEPDKQHYSWPVPEDSKASFISPDQQYLGYVRSDAQMNHREVVLYNLLNQEQLALHRSTPFIKGLFGATKTIAVAFSALNALVAVGYSDGYIEIYRIAGPATPTEVLSLGGVHLPLPRYIIEGESYLKNKQMVMKFNNAYDDLVVIHDVGDCNENLRGNYTFAMTQVFPKKPPNRVDQVT